MRATGYIRAVSIIGYIAMLTGCGQTVVPTKPAADWMMQPPKALTDVPKGASYKDLYADLRSDTATEKAQLRALQKRERTLTGK